jgi:hypothetical protein
MLNHRRAFFIFHTTAKAEPTDQKIMPKTFYANETDIPENLKGAYEAKNGRWELTKLDDDHPVLATNKSLNTEQGRLKGQITTLTTEKETAERERDDARNKSVPHGFRAVPKEVAELGEAVKAVGLKSEEVADLKTKVDEYEKEKTDRAKKALKTKAAAAAGITNTDLFFNLKATDGLEFEEVDGKFLVIEGDKKAAFDAEYLKKSEVFSPVLDKLTTVKQKQTPFPETGGSSAGNIFDKIRESVKSEEKVEKIDLAARFGRPEAV